MRPDITVVATASLASAAIVRGAAVSPDTAPLERASALVDRYVSALVEHQPVDATRIGAHQRDRELPDLSADAVDGWARTVSELLGEVDAALTDLADEPGEDAREARGDLTLLRDELDTHAFWTHDRPRIEIDPLMALDLVSGGVHELLRRVDLDREARRDLAGAAVARARRAPRLLEQAGRHLRGASRPHLDVARQRLPGVVRLLTDELVAQVEQLGGDALAARDAAGVAREGLEAYGALLEELREVPGPDWRLGPRPHARVLRSALGTAMPAADIAARAEAWLRRVRAEMGELAGELWGELVGGPLETDVDARIRRALDAVADEAVSATELVPQARKAVEEARDFTVERGIVDVPPAELLTITEVPGYLQGIAVAFIQPAPALEPEAGSTYYLSPVPDHWDDDQTRSFLREYNPSALRSLALHEGYPGHFVQLEHASRHPRLARRLLASSAFAEGWAVHIERTCVAEGFGDAAYRFTQRKLELRLAANALLDIGMHAGDLDDVGARTLLLESAFQEPAEAEGKLVRAKVTSGQLCAYFVGGEELADLEADTVQRRGGGFDRRTFHQQLLAHGTPSTAIVREALRAGDAGTPPRRPFARWSEGDAGQ